MVEIRQQKARQCVTTRSDSEWPTYLGHDLPVSRARLSCLLWLARSPTVQRPCCTLWILPDHLLPTPLLLSSPLLYLPTYPQPQPPCAAYADPRYDTTPLLPVPPNRAGAVRNVPSTHPPPSPTQCHLLTYSDGLIDGLPSLRPVGTLNTGSPASRRGRTRPRSRTSATATLLLALYRRRHHPVTRRAEQYLPRRRSCFRLTRLFFLALYTYIRVSRHLPTRWTRASLHTAPNHPMHCCYGLETAARPLSGRRHRLATSLSRTAAHTALHALWSPTRKTVSSAPI